MRKNLRPVNLHVNLSIVDTNLAPQKFFRGEILEEVNDVMSMLIASPCPHVECPCERGVLTVTDNNYGIGFDFITAGNMIYVHV